MSHSSFEKIHCKVENVNPKMNEPQSQMCSMTINGKMLLIGGEGDYGYSAWRVSNCGFNVSHNKSHSL